MCSTPFLYEDAILPIDGSGNTKGSPTNFKFLLLILVIVEFLPSESLISFVNKDPSDKIRKPL